MKKIKVLFNISNHPTDAWNDEQKEGWDVIDNIPFPHVDAEISAHNVQMMAEDVMHTLGEKMLAYDPDECDLYVYIAGEYTLSYNMVLYLAQYAIEYNQNKKMKEMQFPKLRLVIPASDRIINDDGTRAFVFRQWREVNLLNANPNKGGAI